MHTCPACGKRFGGYYSFAPWCGSQHWAQVDNNKWERENAPDTWERSVGENPEVR